MRNVLKITILLNIIFLPLFASAQISKIVFITDEQHINQNQISEPITVQTQDASGLSFQTTETIDLVFTSTSETGEFLGATGNPATKTMNKNTSNRTFYYRDSNQGNFTITIKGTGRESGKVWQVSQEIAVGTSAVAPTITNQNSEDVSSFESTETVSTQVGVLEVSLGVDRLVAVGTPINFQATIKKNTVKNAPLDFYWSFGDGNFTGVEPNQDLSLGFLQIKEEIPGSSFVALGDSQYVFLPKDVTYDFVFSGTGNGEVTVEIKNFVYDAPELITSFTDIPVTETSQASFVVEASEPLKTRIQIDEDGDGEIDSLILPDNTNLSLSDLLQILKDKISSLNIKDKIKKNLLKRINNLEKKIERKKEQNVKILERIEKDINNKTKNGRIDVNGADEILNIISELDAVSNSIQLDPGLLLSLKTKIESLSIKPALETSLIIRVEKLEKKQMLTNTLTRLNNKINKNQDSGKMSDTDANEIIKILEQIESLL